MSDHDLLESVEQARERLTALRSWLGEAATADGSPEIEATLRDLQAGLDQLQARCSLMREILDRSCEAVFAKDLDGRYVMMNPTGARMLGRTVAEVLGEDDTGLLETGLALQIMAIDREILASRQPRTMEQTMVLAGGSITLITTKAVWCDLHGNLRGIIGTSYDVTEHRRSERDAVLQQERLRCMAAEIVLAEERLRRSLAADLHSGLGQDIALARMRLGLLRPNASTELIQPLKTIEKHLEQADRSVRSITFQLSPPVLHDLGLLEALEWLGEDCLGRYELELHIEDDDAPQVQDDRTRLLLFRAVREILVNASTHAGARTALLRLGRQDERLSITIEHPGIGYSDEKAGEVDDHLFGLREQLKQVNGSIRCESSAERGTRLTLTAPIEAAQPAAL